MFSSERLIRTELATLLGLIVKAPWSTELPAPSVLAAYIERTDVLMRELHDCMPGSLAQLRLGADGLPDFSAMQTGLAMREPIFYGGESAYIFQYRDLALEKYARDDAWLREQKGFDMAAAHGVVKAMARLQDAKATQLWHAHKGRSDWNGVDLLPAYTLTAAELAAASELALAQVHAVLDALCLSHQNAGFQSLSDFNAVYAAPLLRLADGSCCNCCSTARPRPCTKRPSTGCGRTSPIARPWGSTAATSPDTVRRLAHVFGASRVHRNVHLVRKKGERAGEIDVLVVYGDRLVVVQTKSKRLTQEARKGNDQVLREDFRKAIQDAYDQAQSCAELLLQGGRYRRRRHRAAPRTEAAAQGNLRLHGGRRPLPCLGLSSRALPADPQGGFIREPLVMDMLLDSLTEMLETPLRFLSYASLRAQLAGRLAISHELTALGHHWPQPLVGSPDELRLAAQQLGRRTGRRNDGSPRRHSLGPACLTGILTRFAVCDYESLIAQLEHSEEPAALELGFFLLTLGSNTYQEINERVAMITRMARSDGGTHDFTLGVNAAQAGITFHCNPVADETATRRLQAYCHARKYVQRAQRWFGLSVDPQGGLQFALVLDFPWQQSAELTTSRMRRNKSLGQQPTPRPAGVKVGRNDPCPCGSGKKYGSSAGLVAPGQPGAQLVPLCSRRSSSPSRGKNPDFLGGAPLCHLGLARPCH